MDISETITLFRELVRCGGGVSFWQYDGGGNLLSSNSPDEELFDSAFSLFGCKERMLCHAARSRTPLILSSDLGLIWGAAFAWEQDTLTQCCVLGPVFYPGTSLAQIRRAFLQRQTSGDDPQWRRRFTQALELVPTTQHIILARDVLMLHYCLTGERLEASNLAGTQTEREIDRPAEREADRHRVWSAERAMLQMVRDGNPDYQDTLNRSMLLSNGVPLQSGMPLRQAKISIIVFCSIVCRAAIEGGLSPDEGYSLGDAYIQRAEDAHAIDELSALAVAMYGDFIRRVHLLRENPSYSPHIQRCCDYIENHLNRNIQAKDLTKLVGYSANYLTRRFREETGISLSDYVKFARIERAKLLLSTTDLNIQAIADELGFTTRSYFSQCFRQVVGQTPKEYRENTARTGR